ncbi:hypothetical protein DAETH_38330 (plasmid) [Deinococcus aetherius]|uniref:VOC domain-containing protein n=1 Tax=Deinococcus aetherius TaxID=200252 RepID=A0ABM8AJ82_9DEIO|nr:VOC family protein [Deinococcus aetherius]BDP43864.1 hypothetical protein DAETH_38330 [Deinococcus aetherius]
MDLGYVIVYVPDVVAAVEFYERAFGLRRRFVDGGGQYAELDTGRTRLAFASPAMAENLNLAVRVQRPDQAAAGTELVFVTPEVASAFERAVAAGAVPVRAPAEMPWGQTVSYVRDRHGALIELCTPVAEDT